MKMLVRHYDHLSDAGQNKQSHLPDGIDLDEPSQDQALSSLRHPPWVISEFLNGPSLLPHLRGQWLEVPDGNPKPDLEEGA